jgi:hypothetical protein
MKGVSLSSAPRRFDWPPADRTKGWAKKGGMTACIYENMLTWEHEAMN